MPTLHIRQGEASASFAFTGTPLLWEALMQAGYPVEAPCGGRGVCKKCAVLALTGEVSPPTDAEARAGVRLACQARLLGDASVTLPPARVWEGIETGTGMAGTAANTATGSGTTSIGANKTGMGAYTGATGAEKRTADAGTVGAAADTTNGDTAGTAGTGRAAGTTDRNTNASGTVGAANPSPRRPVAPMPGRYGAAVDVGTTTVAARVFDLTSGEALGEYALVNPQTAVAADVMGRISAAAAGELARLQAMAEAAVRSAVGGACRAAGIPRADALCVAGNTVMLTLLTGRDPRPLGIAPFRADCLFGITESLDGAPMYLPPCAGAFMGADLTCAALATGLWDSRETALLCDIGTNGELMLRHGGALYAASAPAGPAFEGGQISRGVGGVRGAIDRVWAEGGRLRCHVIGGGEAVGLCGSGVIDTVAALLALGLVDKSGTAEAETFALQDGVTFTAADVRAVQLAKAAVCAATESLLAAAGIAPRDVGRVFLAGGFGTHVRAAGAAAISLLPAPLAVRAQAVGNAALTGAAMLLLDTGLRGKAEAIANGASVLALGGDEGFEKRFLAGMDFPVYEEE